MNQIRKDGKSFEDSAFRQDVHFITSEGAPGGEHFDEFLDAAGFDDVAIGAEFIGAADVSVTRGGAEDIDMKMTKEGIGADGGEDFEAVDAREFQVEKNGDRHGVFIPVGINARALQVSESLLAVSDGGEEVGDLRGFPSSLHEEGIVRIIFDQEDSVGVEISLH